VETVRRTDVYVTRGWISAALWAGVKIEDYPALKKWEERIWSRPSVQKGANVPEPYKMKELLADPAAMEKHAAKVRCELPFTGLSFGDSGC